MTRMFASRTHWPLVLSLALLSLLFWAAASRMSVVVDGVRYHYLDDDQMISMRYARNLADGLGAVWNAGERVEGYTNFGWMLVMAAVHAAGAGDATAAWWVRLVNWWLACAVLACTWLLLMRLGAGVLGAGAALLALGLSTDLLAWAVNGFETTMLTAVFVLSIVRALEDHERGGVRPTTLLLAGLLPVIRADALDLAAGVVLVCVVLEPRAGWRRAWIAAVPLAAHELFRIAYYGDYLPNTYYLKVAGRTALWWTAAGNLKAFALTYAVLVVFAAAAFFGAGDRRVRLLAMLPAAGAARMLFTGPDVFPGFRFLAPYVPVLLTVAGVMVSELAGASTLRRRTLAALLLFGTIGNAGVVSRERVEDLPSVNGYPAIHTVAGVLVARHTRPDSTIAVLAAGSLGYFSRRAALDLLGRTDRHIARLPVHPRAPTGHNRYDIEWSLAKRPDITAGFGPHGHIDADAAAARLPGHRGDETFAAALATSRTFQTRYLPHPVPVSYLLERSVLYVRDDSPELARLTAWREPHVTSP